MNKEIQNCRKCLSSYTKDDYWCEVSIAIDGKLKEPVGYCDFCRIGSPFYLDVDNSNKDIESIV